MTNVQQAEAPAELIAVVDLSRAQTLAALVAAVDRVVAEGVGNSLLVNTTSVGHVEWVGTLGTQGVRRVYAIARRDGGIELRVDDNDRSRDMGALITFGVIFALGTFGLSIAFAIAVWYWRKRRVRRNTERWLQAVTTRVEAGALTRTGEGGSLAPSQPNWTVR